MTRSLILFLACLSSNAVFADSESGDQKKKPQAPLAGFTSFDALAAEANRTYKPVFLYVFDSV